jgi:hypothetical protein
VTKPIWLWGIYLGAPWIWIAFVAVMVPLLVFTWWASRK